MPPLSLLLYSQEWQVDSHLWLFPILSTSLVQSLLDQTFSLHLILALLLQWLLCPSWCVQFWVLAASGAANRHPSLENLSVPTWNFLPLGYSSESPHHRKRNSSNRLSIYALNPRAFSFSAHSSSWTHIHIFIFSTGEVCLELMEQMLSYPCNVPIFLLCTGILLIHISKMIQTHFINMNHVRDKTKERGRSFKSIKQEDCHLCRSTYWGSRSIKVAFNIQTMEIQYYAVNKYSLANTKLYKKT